MSHKQNDIKIEDQAEQRIEILGSFNDLEKHVAEWINERAVDYDDGVAGAMMDLSNGCSSGYVNHLIYTKDCNDFYFQYADEIDDLLESWHDETGENALSSYQYNVGVRNWLAWFAFEETARRVASQAGINI